MLGHGTQNGKREYSTISNMYTVRDLDGNDHLKSGLKWFGNLNFPASSTVRLNRVNGSPQGE